MLDSWKTDLEGGRVPLVGIGELRGEADDQQMVDGFEWSRFPQPLRDRCQ
jgi:hypothetical protein